MDWITDDIVVGSYQEAQEIGLLRQHSVRSILSQTRNLKEFCEKDLGVELISTIPLIDGAGNDPRWFREAIDSLTELVQLAPPVLVHCRAGRSRSAAVVAGYLMRLWGLSAEKALELIAAKREIAVVPELMVLLEEQEEG